jgi:hypothetical protein
MTGFERFIACVDRGFGDSGGLRGVDKKSGDGNPDNPHLRSEMWGTRGPARMAGGFA